MYPMFQAFFMTIDIFQTKISMEEGTSIRISASLLGLLVANTNFIYW